MNNEYLRHTLSTIDYRFKKSVKYRNVGFGDYTAGKGSRTPNEIINHMYQVLKAMRIFIEEERFEDMVPEKLELEKEIARFNTEIETLDGVLAHDELGVNYAKRLLQGPLSDILTHIGQISMLSRLNDHPIEWEDFSSSPISTGKK